MYDIFTESFAAAAESSNAQALVEDDPMDNDDDVEMGGSEGEELGVKTEDDDMAEWSFIGGLERSPVALAGPC